MKPAGYLSVFFPGPSTGHLWLAFENSSILSGLKIRSLKFRFCSSANSPHCVFSFVVEDLVTLRLRNVPHTS